MMGVYIHTHVLISCKNITVIRFEKKKQFITLHCSGFLLDIMISLDFIFFLFFKFCCCGFFFVHAMPGLCNECHTAPWDKIIIVNWFPLNGATMHKTAKKIHFPIFSHSNMERPHFLACFFFQ